MSGQAALYDFLLTDIFSSVVTATQIWCCNIVKEVKGLRSRLALLFASEPDPQWIIPLVMFACLPHAHTWKTKPTTGFVPSCLCEFYEDRHNVPIQAAVVSWNAWEDGRNMAHSADESCARASSTFWGDDACDRQGRFLSISTHNLCQADEAPKC